MENLIGPLDMILAFVGIGVLFVGGAFLPRRHRKIVNIIGFSLVIAGLAVVFISWERGTLPIVTEDTKIVTTKLSEYELQVSTPLYLKTIRTTYPDAFFRGSMRQILVDLPKK